MVVDPEGSISQLKGVGPKLQKTLGRLGIFRLLDLLIHLPARYQDRSQLTPLGALKAGDDAFVEGEILVGEHQAEENFHACQRQKGLQINNIRSVLSNQT